MKFTEADNPNPESRHGKAFPTVALLTDFGYQDGFTGVMKGVIYSLIQTPAALVDISHGIAPQNVWQGAWVLGNSYAVFPRQTVFVCVVDPGVGVESQAHLLAYWPERSYFFLAPDNGLLSAVLQKAGPAMQVYRIENDAFFYKGNGYRISQTFHGRDVYAPVAAHLLNALENNLLEGFLENLGPQVSDCRLLPWQPPARMGNCLEGQLMHIDVYGNLISNIPAEWLERKADLTVMIGETKWESGFSESYQGGSAFREPFLLGSSSGMLELALNKGSAAAFTNAQVGDKVTLFFGQGSSI